MNTEPKNTLGLTLNYNSGEVETVACFYVAIADRDLSIEILDVESTDLHEVLKRRTVRRAELKSFSITFIE